MKQVKGESTMAGEAKVFIVNSDYQADYKVFFVDSDYQEKNAQIIKGGKLVNSTSQANVKVFIVDSDYKADIKITRKNFPR
jgi:dUTPase